MPWLLLLIPVGLIGLCAVSACILGGRCERALGEHLSSGVHVLEPPHAETEPEVAFTAHG